MLALLYLNDQVRQAFVFQLLGACVFSRFIYSMGSISQRTDAFWFSIYRSQSMALSETLGSRPGLRLIRYSMAECWGLILISSRFSIPR